MNTNELRHDRLSDRAGRGNAVMAPVDIVLAEARRLRAQEMDRLLRAGLRRSGRILVSLFAPIFGWNRRAIDPRLRYDRQASLAAYVKGLRADAEAANNDRWLGHGA